MVNAADFDSAGVGAHKEEPVITHTQPQFFASLEGLHVAGARFGETVQCEENLHCDRLAEASDIGFGGVGPDNPLHLGA